jgi:hypothetical protein
VQLSRKVFHFTKQSPNKLSLPAPPQDAGFGVTENHTKNCWLLRSNSHYGNFSTNFSHPSGKNDTNSSLLSHLGNILGRFLKYDIHSLIHTENCWLLRCTVDDFSVIVHWEPPVEWFVENRILPQAPFP